MGNPVPGYRERLTALARTVAANLSLDWSRPVAPAAVVDWCRYAEIGLCAERRSPRNKEVCLSNKSLVYPLAGLALACTNTEGQRELAQDFGEGVRYYDPGDARGLAELLRTWAEDPGRLLRARRASWDAARTRWHWDHAEEKGRLIGAIQAALGHDGLHASR